MSYHETIRVHGQPAPKGSFKPQPRGKPMVHDGVRYYQLRHVGLADMSKHLKPWVKAVKQAAAGHLPGVLIDGPVEVGVPFYFEAPKSPKDPRWPVGREGDLDKLLRAVGDALQGIVYKDDKQIVRWFPAPAKRFGEPGAVIEIRSLEIQGELF